MILSRHLNQKLGIGKITTAGNCGKGPKVSMNFTGFTSIPFTCINFQQDNIQLE